MPSTRPRVVFTDGVCNACLFRDEYARTDWAARRAEFVELVKSRKKHPVYDCVVPFSGGKDSAAIAWRLKFELGFNPLLVTFGQLLWTDVGRRNWERVREAGFDIVYWGTDQAVSRKLARRFLIERGHPKNHYDAAVNAVPVITALNFGIPLVVFAEHGESFYGGHVLSDEHRRRRDLAEVLENQVGDDARNWAVDGITEANLFPYVMPERAGEIEAVYFSYYFKWDIYANATLAREKMGFEQARHNFCTANQRVWTWGIPKPGILSEEATVRMRYDRRHSPQSDKQWSLPRWWGRSDGSFEGFDSIDDKIDDLDYYMMHVKFGFGRAARMASRLIQAGHMDRATGLDLVRRFDGEFPRTYLHDVLDWLGMDAAELEAVVDKHRNPEIWKQENGAWTLRHPPA